jgi:nucleotide-binding universal stress UspA family protein
MATKVLLPVDGLRNSVAAEDYALELSGKMPLEITLLNIFKDKNIKDHGLNPDLQASIREAHKKTVSKVLDEVEQKFQKNGYPVEKIILSGEPGELICRYAKEKEFDMIIIAASGFTEFQDWFMGSVTNYVLYRCSCPVMLIKPYPPSKKA